MKSELEDLFPSLASSGYRETSKRTPDYNCIAWAAGDDSKWWDALPIYYWPDNVPRSFTVDGMGKVFESLGYVECSHGDLESNFEKVAIFGDKHGYSHAARQLSDGKWTSKIGGLEDIEHDTLAGLEGEEYGAVMKYLKRPRR